MKIEINNQEYEMLLSALLLYDTQILHYIPYDQDVYHKLGIICSRLSEKIVMAKDNENED